MRLCILSFALLSTGNCLAQTGSEIFLFDLQLKQNGITLTNGKNITNRVGYDNQPFFHPDKTEVYFTAADTAGRTDILVYDYTTNKTKNFTQTREREYSPTVTPDKKYISCIIQRDNGAQDLGKYPIEGGEPIVIINTLTVGYHAWVDNETLIVFVLGEPNTLHWVSVREGADEILAENIGRSLHAIPASTEMSFVHKVTSEKWLIKKITLQNKSIVALSETIPLQQDLAWTPDKRIVMSDGEKLFYCHPGSGNTWREINTESALPANGITRISINKKGDKMAIVVGE